MYLSTYLSTFVLKYCPALPMPRLHKYMLTYISLRTYAHINLHAYIAYVSTCMHIYLCPYIHRLIPMYIHSLHNYMHAYLHTHIHTYIHTYIASISTCMHTSIYAYIPMQLFLQEPVNK